MTTNDPPQGRDGTAEPSRRVVVRPATEGDRERWNAFVAAQGAPALSRFEWADILESSYGVKTHFLVAEAEGAGRLQGVLGLYETRSLRGRRHVYSLRHGLVAEDDAVAAALVGRVGELFPEEAVAGLLLTSGYRSHDLPVPASRQATLVLPLVEDEDALWSGVRSKTRNMIRKAQRSGVEVTSDRDRLREVHRVYERHMVAMGIPLHTKRFFELTLAALGEDAELLVALLDGEVIGGTLVLHAPGAAIYPYQTASGDHLDKAPNQLMIWEAMLSAARRGIPRLDMGESQRGGSTYRFKHNFGGEDEHVHYYDPLRREPDPGTSASDGASDSSGGSRARRLASALPFGPARLLQRFLRRRGRVV